ncbi:venom serine carboxypeptidase-like [Episyrphus balteatus]|uniref:venom serine carboxypeptidase-like n=1 Tax=Episyrphus balteatus TaxID=286459 RepID=UPI002485F44A|nr:venom serine carboxypeptidase-like [Episyrphus balteatus]
MAHIHGTFLLAGIIISLCLCTILNFASASLPNKPYRRSFINPYPRFKAYHDKGNPGEPLYLTPMIEAKNITAARTAAKVVDNRFHNVTSYAGYLTVDKRYNSNMFFWYFPAEYNQPYAPVVLWLQGGPGASSLFGLFQENGPFEFKKAKAHLERRAKYSWSEKMNLIYIDNPVGTGFSFTDDDKGYSRNERQVAKNLQEAVRQLFKLFDFALVDGFWITGESYAGKYIPALAYYIHHNQNSVHNDVDIPLKGVAIGNGLSDPQNQLNYGDYLYQLGLLDINSYRHFQILEQEAVDLIHEHDLAGAFDILDSLMNIDGKFNASLFRNVTGYSTYFNYLQPSYDEGEVGAMGTFLQSSDTRRAIHVGNKTFHDLDTENKVEEYLKEDVMDSVAPWVADLLNYYTVCIYNGQLDIIVAYPMTVNYLQNLKFSSADVYKIAKRDIWRVDKEVAGYKKRAGNLLEVMVRNAGHMVPRDQPKWMFDLITDLTGTKD